MASLLKGVLENTDEQPEEQIDTQGEVWEGPEPRSFCTCEFGVVTLPIWKLSEVHTIGIFMEASSCSHDQLLICFQPPSPLWRSECVHGVGECGWKFQASNHGLVFLVTMTNMATTSLEQKMFLVLLSVRN